MAGLKIMGLVFSRPGFSLQVDMELRKGEFGAVLGASGCGKSTTLRLIAGLLQAESGSLVLNGRELMGLPPERRKVGLMFQDLALFPQLSARKNIEYGPKLAGLSRAERREKSRELGASLRMEGLLERRPGALSGGEQQRVALARSLAAEPELLLLDEPLSSLDAALRKELRRELKDRIKERGLSALHVTHDIDEAFAVADRIFLMDRGRIVQEGLPAEIWEAPNSALSARILGRGPLFEIRAIESVGDGLVAITAAGRFSVAPAARPGATWPDDKPGFLHFAGDAALLAEAEATVGRNRMRAIVVSETGAARSGRIEVEVEGQRFDLALPRGRHVLEGEALVLEVATSDCRILPARP